MTPFEVISILLILITAIAIPTFNYLNFTKQTIIKNDITNSLESKTNKIRDDINENASNIKALTRELRYTIKACEQRIDKIERYLEKLNGFSPSSADTHGSRRED